MAIVGVAMNVDRDENIVNVTGGMDVAAVMAEMAEMEGTCKHPGHLLGLLHQQPCPTVLRGWTVWFRTSNMAKTELLFQEVLPQVEQEHLEGLQWEAESKGLEVRVRMRSLRDLTT